MTRSLSVELEAVLHWWPENPAIFTDLGLLADDAVVPVGVAAVLELHVLVDLAGTPAVLRVAPVGGRPVEQVLGAATYCLQSQRTLSLPVLDDIGSRSYPAIR